MENYGHEDESIAKVEGFTVFIVGALKGEVVKVKIIKVNKNYGGGKLLEVIEASEKRVESICGTYKRCGGCNLQRYSYLKKLRRYRGWK